MHKQFSHIGINTSILVFWCHWFLWVFTNAKQFRDNDNISGSYFYVTNVCEYLLMHEQFSHNYRVVILVYSYFYATDFCEYLSVASLIKLFPIIIIIITIKKINIIIIIKGMRLRHLKFGKPRSCKRTWVKWNRVGFFVCVLIFNAARPTYLLMTILDDSIAFWSGHVSGIISANSLETTEQGLKSGLLFRRFSSSTTWNLFSILVFWCHWFLWIFTNAQTI